MQDTKYHLPFLYAAYTTTLLLTATCSSICYAANCIGNTITIDCTAAPGNTGYTFLDSATLTMNGADVGFTGVPNQSITLNPDVTGTLLFLSTQQITGLTSGDTSTILGINIPNSTTANFNASASAGNVLISGDGNLALNNSSNSSLISGLYAFTTSGADASLTLQNTNVTVTDSNPDFEQASGLIAATCFNGSATLILGSGDVTATALTTSVQYVRGIAAISSILAPGQGNATLIGGSGTVNAFQIGAWGLGTGTTSVILGTGTVNTQFLFAENDNVGNVIIDTQSAPVNVTGNMYANSANGNIDILLGSSPTIVNGFFYAQANGPGDINILTGNGGLTVGGNMFASISDANNTAAINFQGPASISGDLGVYSTGASDTGIGLLSIGQNAVTSGTLFAYGLNPLYSNSLNIGLGGLTVNSQGFTLRNADSLTFDLNHAIPAAPLLNLTNVVGNTLTLISESTVSVQNPSFVTQTLTLAQAPAGLTSEIGVNYINVPNFITTWSSANNQIVLNLIYNGSNIIDNSDRSNTMGIGAALSQMNLNNLSGELLEIFDSINLASNNPTALNNALAATAPLVDASTVAVWSHQTALNNLLLNHMITTPQASNERHYSAGDCEDQARRVWIAVLGSHLNQQLRNQIPGYRGNIGGVVFGGEILGENGYAGIAADLSELHLHANVSPSTTHVNHYAVDLYGRYDDLIGSVFVDGILAGGYNQYHGSRNVAYGTVAISPYAKYNGWQVDALGRAGIDYETCLFRISPYIIAEYDYLATRDYTETGAGTANQSVNGAHYDQFLMGAGFNFEQTWNCNQIAVQPNLNATYLYALKNATMQAISQFVGSGPAFATIGATPARSQYLLGAALTFIYQENLETTFIYQTQIENNFLAQTGFIRLRYRL